MNEILARKAGGRQVVLPFFISAALFLVIFSAGVFFSAGELKGHYFQPHLLALVHVLLLGFCTMVIFGALCQLLPVLSEKPLYSRKLAAWSCGMLTGGTMLLGYAFWTFRVGYLMETAAVLVLIAVTLQVINVLLTLKQAKSTPSLDCIGTAHLWLFVTVLIGVLLAFNFRYAFLPQHQLHYLVLHAHLGLAGWFLLLIIGAASRLLPMFLLASGDYTKPIRLAYYLVNAALLLFLVDVLFTHSYARAFVYVLIAGAGIGCFFYFVRAALKKSMRKKKDESMKQTLAAILFLVLPLALAVLNALPGNLFTEAQQLRLSRVYGISLLPGFLVMLILGQTFKTLPFILWLDLKEKYRLPVKWMPRDLYHAGVVTTLQWTWNAGILLLMAGSFFEQGLLVLIASLLLLAASLLYLSAVLFMLRRQNFPLLNEGKK